MDLEINGVTAARPNVSAQENQIRKSAPIANSVQAAPDRTSLPKEQIKNHSEDQVSFNSPSISANAMGTLKNLEKLQDKSNEIAQDIRITNKSIGTITDMVSKMQSSLSSITKNFPPFNVDSKERQDILMSYISIRKELIKMSVPPPPPPIYKNISDIWKSVVGKDGLIVPETVPALQANSSDGEVQQAEKNLKNTRETIAGISSAVNSFRPES